MSGEAQKRILAALRKREENGGRHLHHRDCIHNLPPEQQVEMRGKTVEWWTALIGPLPEQITPEQWETEPPNWDGAEVKEIRPLSDAETTGDGL